MSLLDSLPHTVSLYRPTTVRDGIGGDREGTAVTIKSSASAWVQNASRQQINDFDKRDELVSHNVFFTTEYSLRPGDYIYVDSGPSFVDKRLDYVAQSERSAGLGKLFGVICNEDNNQRFSSFS